MRKVSEAKDGDHNLSAKGVGLNLVQQGMFSCSCGHNGVRGCVSA